MINYKENEIKKKLLRFKSNLEELHSGLDRLENKTVFFLPVKDFQSHKWQDQIQSQQ